MALNPVDVVAGVILVIAGLVTISGWANLGAVLGGLGLLAEAIKILINKNPNRSRAPGYF